MLPANENIWASERKRDEIMIQHELGHTLRRSFDSMMRDPLPPQMALLLMQLALTEIMRMVAEECETRR